jgi:hypothetical protein
MDGYLVYDPKCTLHYKYNNFLVIFFKVQKVTLSFLIFNLPFAKTKISHLKKSILVNFQPFH